MEIVQGTQTTYDTSELHYAARLASHRGLYGASARTWVETFGRDRARLFGKQWRQDAAAAAALAGTGVGRDADQIGEAERSDLRSQSLDWLQRELQEANLEVASSNPRAGLKRLGKMLFGIPFATVRNPDALSRLPPEERAEWEAFWTEVRELLYAHY